MSFHLSVRHPERRCPKTPAFLESLRTGEVRGRSGQRLLAALRRGPEEQAVREQEPGPARQEQVLPPAVLAQEPGLVPERQGQAPEQEPRVRSTREREPVPEAVLLPTERALPEQEPGRADVLRRQAFRQVILRRQRRRSA